MLVLKWYKKNEENYLNDKGTKIGQLGGKKCNLISQNKLLEKSALATKNHRRSCGIRIDGKGWILIRVALRLDNRANYARVVCKCIYAVLYIDTIQLFRIGRQMKISISQFQLK